MITRCGKANGIGFARYLLRGRGGYPHRYLGLDRASKAGSGDRRTGRRRAGRDSWAARSQGAWRANGSLRTVTEADAEAIAQEVADIAAVAPLLRGSVQVVYGNRNRATTLRGITPTWFEARPWPVTMGRPLADEDVRRSGKVVLLAHGVAKNLFGKDDPTGRTIRIDQVPFTVIGVLEEKGHSLGGEDLDDQVVVPLTTARKRILGFFSGHPTAVGGLTLRVADGADMDRRREAVRDGFFWPLGPIPNRKSFRCGRILNLAAAIPLRLPHGRWLLAAISYIGGFFCDRDAN